MPPNCARVGSAQLPKPVLSTGVTRCTALIVAAGRGSRFGGPLPKQYALLDGAPVLRRTIAAFQGTPAIDRILVVIGPGDDELYEAATRGLDLPPPVPGGGRLGDIAGEVLDIARAGLTARASANGAGDSEAGFLEPLDEIVRSGKVPAQRLLDKFHGEWAGDISRVYEEKF